MIKNGKGIMASILGILVVSAIFSVIVVNDRSNAKVKAEKISSVSEDKSTKTKVADEYVKINNNVPVFPTEKDKIVNLKNLELHINDRTVYTADEVDALIDKGIAEYERYGRAVISNLKYADDIRNGIIDKNSIESKSYGACIKRNDSIVGINEDKPFAMHSVMKFPQALYVADYLSRKGLDLDDTIVVDKAELMQNTWSPMLKRFEGKTAFSFAELLELSLGQSDNNASELLFKFCGRPKAVEKYMRKLGFHDMHVRMTEEQMHKNPEKAIENSSTPAEMVRLFEWFYQHKDDNQYLTFIWKAMANCSTGLKRIPAAIPAETHIVHKTGTGFPSAEGLQDMNDAGIILMPEGSYVLIAVFTTNSSSEAVIANITRQLLDTIIK